MEEVWFSDYTSSRMEERITTGLSLYFFSLRTLAYGQKGKGMEARLSLALHSQLTAEKKNGSMILGSIGNGIA